MRYATRQTSRRILLGVLQGAVLWALFRIVVGNLRASSGFDIKLVNALAAAALVTLAIYLIVAALIKLRGDRKASLAPAEA